VIVSIVGGEDMRLLEVDEAANHIKELVDPDANIIWGSAFNNDLDGRIRVSVVATGIDSDASVQPEPSKLFAFPPRSRTEARIPGSEAPAAPAEAPTPAAPSDELMLGAEEPAAAAFEEEELVLGQSDDQVEEIVAEIPADPEPTEPPAPRRRWTPEAVEPASEPPAPRSGREGATLFERMSSMARGASKAGVEEESEDEGNRDPLDIPRFLNRQSNQ
jgi:cell division protein FtsZ